MVFSINVILRKVTLAAYFRHYFLYIATVNLLQSLRSFEKFQLNYYSQDVTELYPILLHRRTIPYLNTLPNNTLPYCITEVSSHKVLGQNIIR